MEVCMRTGMSSARNVRIATHAVRSPQLNWGRMLRDQFSHHETAKISVACYYWAPPHYLFRGLTILWLSTTFLFASPNAASISCFVNEQLGTYHDASTQTYILSPTVPFLWVLGMTLSRRLLTEHEHALVVTHSRSMSAFVGRISLRYSVISLS